MFTARHISWGFGRRENAYIRVEDMNYEVLFFYMKGTVLSHTIPRLSYSSPYSKKMRKRIDAVSVPEYVILNLVVLLYSIHLL